MTKQHRNSYDDDDLRQILAEIDAFEAEKVSIKAEAAGRIGGIAKRIKQTKANARDLGIPIALLNALLKTRALERKMEAVAEAVPEELAELFEDAIGQFSFLAPVGDEAPAAPARKAAKKARTAAEENQAREQAEGAAVLDGLTSVTH